MRSGVTAGGEATTVSLAAASTAAGATVVGVAFFSCGGWVRGGDLAASSLTTCFVAFAGEELSELGDFTVVSEDSFVLTRRSVRRMPVVVLTLGLATSRRVEAPARWGCVRVTSGLAAALVAGTVAPPADSAVAFVGALARVSALLRAALLDGDVTVGAAAVVVVEAVA